MKSKYILIFHTVQFILLIIGSITSSIIVVFFPEILSGRDLLYVLIALTILMVSSWPLFGGCPFTVWENYHRERENPGSSYRGSCMVMYSKKWFNMSLPGRFDIYIPIALVVFPAILALFNL